MRRNLRSRYALNSWKTSKNTRGDSHTLHHTSLVRIFKLSLWARKLAPKFLLSAVETTQTASVRYYPNLLNGQNSRTTLAWRIFDVVSLSWLINIFRLCIFCGFVYIVVYFTNISGSWGYIFFSALLYAELTVHTVYSFFTSFSAGFVVLCCYSLC